MPTTGNRAVTMPNPELEWDNGTNNSFNHHNQQQQHQQQTGSALNQNMTQNGHQDQSPSSHYYEPQTGVSNFAVPVQMVPVSYMMPSGQEGYQGYPMLVNTDGQYVDPSALSPQADGSMPYDFSTQGVWFMPVSPDQFVPMNQGQMPVMDASTSKNEQKGPLKGNGHSNFQTQQYNQGPVSQPHHGNGNMRDKRLPGGKKQREVPSTSQMHEGPKAVLVDLSKLRPVNRASNSSGRPWYKQ